MEFKKVLKILAREGYPNPNLDNIFDAIDYDGEWFLVDLTKELGIRGAEDFVRKTLNKLSETNKQDYEIKVPLRGYDDSWVKLVIYDFYIDDEESETDIIVNYSFDDSRIVNPDGEVTTMQQIWDEMDLGGMNDWEDFKDEVRTECYNYISKRCGFGIWYQ